MSPTSSMQATFPRRHPFTATCRLEYWPTKTDGTHVVAVHPSGVVQQVGVLWGAA